MTAVLIAGVFATAGCGGDDSSDGAATTTATATPPVSVTTTTTTATSPEQLSPEAQKVLSRSQALAADAAATAAAYRDQRLSRDSAKKRLELYRGRAHALAQEAKRLPERDAARGRLARLTTDLEQQANHLRDAISAGDARKELDKALRRLGG